MNTIITRRQQRPTIATSSLKLRFIESSSTDEDETTQIVLEEISNNSKIDEAIRSSATQMEELYGVGWFDKSEAWKQMKIQYPFLSDYDDEILRLLFLRQSPKLLDLLTKTPLGPFLAINLLFLITGFSWCDTPFGQIESCSP